MEPDELEFAPVNANMVDHDPPFLYKITELPPDTVLAHAFRETSYTPLTGAVNLPEARVNAECVSKLIFVNGITEPEVTAIDAFPYIDAATTRVSVSFDICTEEDQPEIGTEALNE
jgi:hypothetical protein